MLDNTEFSPIPLQTADNCCAFRGPAINLAAMASSAAASAVRRIVSRIATTTPAAAASGTRQFHSTGAKRYSNDYIHAEHMYDITAMKNRKVKIAVGTFGALAIGIMVPIWAVQFQMKKQGGAL